MAGYYIGLMSGTSLDGIDAVLVGLEAQRPELLEARTLPWPASLLRSLRECTSTTRPLTLCAIGELDAAIGEALGRAALTLLEASKLPAGAVRAIGSHGHTLFHAPEADPPFSWQCGDPARIAEITGIDTVADFRRRDIAAGGQGAPLVPAFHQALFRHPTERRAVLNIGGMANLTLLPPTAGQTPPRSVTGFDTGPGNVLLDGWAQRHLGTAFDANGDWARGGKVSDRLLQHLLEDPYFERPPPKSTGREHFGMEWLEARLRDIDPAPSAQDVQTTLLALSAQSICRALRANAPDTERLLVCGGGAHNTCLMQALDRSLPDTRVESTRAHGLDPDWVEATAFAWLAKRALERVPGNLPTVTGARHPAILGAIHYA